MNPPHPLRKPSSKASGSADRHNRAAFLARATLGILGTITALGEVSGVASAAGAGRSASLKEKRESKVRRWDVITLGNLSRNRYWSEGDDRGVRAAICTCTVIQGAGFRLLVDPSLAEAGRMTAELDRRTGVKLRDVDAVFVTHEHADHWFGLAHFPEAKWLAAPEVAAALNETRRFPKQVESATGKLFDAVEVIATPGHTLSHHSLRFDCDGLSVVVAGDAVATRDFWGDRRGYFNCVDFNVSAKSMNMIADLADIVVPGHDNFFLSL
jgi:glyoxylase-like metal-dependent hydrolase (beta-lactamase superfamily II)